MKVLKDGRSTEILVEAVLARKEIQKRKSSNESDSVLPCNGVPL